MISHGSQAESILSWGKIAASSGKISFRPKKRSRVEKMGPKRRYFESKNGFPENLRRQNVEKCEKNTKSQQNAKSPRVGFEPTRDSKKGCAGAMFRQNPPNGGLIYHG